MYIYIKQWTIQTPKQTFTNNTHNSNFKRNSSKGTKEELQNKNIKYNINTVSNSRSLSEGSNGN